MNAHHSSKILSSKQLIFVILSGFGIGYIVLGWYGGTFLGVGLTAMFVMYALRGLATPTFLNLINQHAPSDMRATVLSIRGFTVRVFYALFAPILGWVADVYSIQETFLLMGAVIVLATIVAIGFYSLILQDKP